MDWDQIESKWAAMTRRVRADVQYASLSLRGRQTRRVSADPRLSPITELPGTELPKAHSAMPQE